MVNKNQEPIKINIKQVYNIYIFTFEERFALFTQDENFGPPNNNTWYFNCPSKIRSVFECKYIIVLDL